MRAQKRSKLSGILSVDAVDFELLFATDVLGLQSLHYGYWPSPPSGTISLTDFRGAQAAYSRLLLSYVPDTAQRVLDVGAGVGDNARLLASQGRSVFAISPDANHGKFYPKDAPRLAFEQTRFEDFRTHERFDLVLFSESHNYIDHATALEKSRALAKDGAHVLVSGMFRAPDRGPLAADFVLEDHSYFRAAREQGYAIEVVEDISENVLPTMTLVHDALANIAPLGRLGARYLRSVSPLKARALTLLGRRQLTRLADVLAYYQERTNPDYFRTHMRYAVARMRCPSPKSSIRLVPPLDA